MRLFRTRSPKTTCSSLQGEKWAIWYRSEMGTFKWLFTWHTSYNSLVPAYQTLHPIINFWSFSMIFTVISTLPCYLFLEHDIIIWLYFIISQYRKTGEYTEICALGKKEKWGILAKLIYPRFFIYLHGTYGLTSNLFSLFVASHYFSLVHGTSSLPT